MYCLVYNLVVYHLMYRLMYRLVYNLVYRLQIVLILILVLSAWLQPSQQPLLRHLELFSTGTLILTLALSLFFIDMTSSDPTTAVRATRGGGGHSFSPTCSHSYSLT